MDLVFKVRSKEDGKKYAVKRGLKPFLSMTDRAAKLNEVQKHEQIPRHPNLVRFYRAWEERGCLYIQTELCETSLQDYCDKHHSIPEWRVWHIFIDLLQAVQHLHKHDLVHLDIKPENAFLSADGLCKLGDFGLVTEASEEVEVREGDSRYLAPELLHGKFSKAVDIFSLGMTILEVATDLDVPQYGVGWTLLRSGNLNIALEHIWGEKSEILKNTLADMLSPDAEKRPTADELLRRPYLKRAQMKRTACYRAGWAALGDAHQLPRLGALFPGHPDPSCEGSNDHHHEPMDDEPGFSDGLNDLSSIHDDSGFSKKGEEDMDLSDEINFIPPVPRPWKSTPVQKYECPRRRLHDSPGFNGATMSFSKRQTAGPVQVNNNNTGDPDTDTFGKAVKKVLLDDFDAADSADEGW